MLLFIKLLGIFKRCFVFFLFEAVLCFHRNWEGTEISQIPLAPHMHSRPSCEHPSSDGTFVTIDESTLTDYVTHIPQLLLEFTLGVVWSVGLDKRIHHYRIIQSIFIGMKILCAQPIPPLSPNPWNPDPFTVSILLPFPKCHQGNYTVCSLFKSDSFT